MGTLTNREISNIMENSTEGLRRLKFGARQASGVYVVLPRPPAHFTPNNLLQHPLFFWGWGKEHNIALSKKHHVYPGEAGVNVVQRGEAALNNE